MKGAPKSHHDPAALPTDPLSPALSPRPTKGEGDNSAEAAAVKVRFRVAGRWFTMRKRQRDRFAPWYLVGTINGRRFHHALGTNEAKTAEAVARVKFIQPALDEEWGLVDSNKKKRHWATVGEVLDAWRGLELGAGEAHKRAAANALLNVLRRAGHAEPSGESAGVLTGATAGKYFDAVVREAGEAGDQKAAARVKRSALSVFNQAKAVIQPAALLCYKRAEVNVPDVAEFVAEGVMRRKKFKGIRVTHDPVDWALADKVIAAWPELADWNTFAAVGLELAFGLRAGEVKLARWDWFTVRGASDWWCWADVAVKNQTGEIHVPALNPFWGIFWERATLEGAPQRGPLVLVGTETERCDLTFRRVSAWLRSLGWEKQKTNHGLRAYAGAEVALRWRSPFTTQAWLRHESVTTTEQHYTKQWNEANAARVSRVEWAKA